jgi:hypothetical protein
LSTPSAHRTYQTPSTRARSTSAQSSSTQLSTHIKYISTIGINPLSTRQDNHQHVNYSTQIPFSSTYIAISTHHPHQPITYIKINRGDENFNKIWLQNLLSFPRWRIVFSPQGNDNSLTWGERMTIP